MYIQFDYCGDLKLQKVCVNTDAICTISEPKNEKIGCIIELLNGTKVPVKESYEYVRNIIS